MALPFRPSRAAFVLPGDLARSVVGAVALLLAIAIALSIAASQLAALPGDIHVARLAQSTGDVGGVVAAIGNVAGSARVTLPAIAIAALLLAFRKRHRQAAIVLTALLEPAANLALKLVIASPRPGERFVAVSEAARGHGFPSGHAMAITVTCGLLGYALVVERHDRTTRLVAGAIGALLVISTGFGRVYTGAHWPSDVVGGYLWGMLFLIAAMSAWRLPAARKQPAPMSRLGASRPALRGGRLRAGEN